MDIKELTKKRDVLICEIWNTLKEINGLGDISVDDLHLWELVNNHSTVQNLLKDMTKYYRKIR